MKTEKETKNGGHHVNIHRYDPGNVLEGVLLPILTSVFAIEISPKPYVVCVLFLLPCLFFLLLVSLAMARSSPGCV